MKLCKDCKHLAGIHCGYGSAPKVIDYVNGGLMVHPAMKFAQAKPAQEEREHGLCGPAGIHFDAFSTEQGR